MRWGEIGMNMYLGYAGTIVHAYSTEPLNTWRHFVTSFSMSRESNHMLSAWMHNTPPGRRAFPTSSKNDVSKSSWSGPELYQKYDFVETHLGGRNLCDWERGRERETYWVKCIHYYCIIISSCIRHQKCNSWRGEKTVVIYINKNL